MNLAQRIDAVINTLEQSQKTEYNGITNLVLSYLYDIKNDRLPDWVKEHD